MSMRVSLTVDAWSSRIFRSYFCVNAHWINPKWYMQSAVIGFLTFEIPHDESSVQTILTECLDDWNTLNKFMAITSENCSEIVRGLDLLVTHVGRDVFHIRCTAHVINLLVKAAFSKIQNSIESLCNIIRNVRVSVKRRRKCENLKLCLNKPNDCLPL